MSRAQYLFCITLFFSIGSLVFADPLGITIGATGTGHYAGFIDSTSASSIPDFNTFSHNILRINDSIFY